MPTYVYKCSSCDTVFEAEQRITEPPLTSCGCGSDGTIKRVIQPTAVLFKGPGFHVNDYGSKVEAEKQSLPDCTGDPQACPSCAPIPDS